MVFFCHYNGLLHLTCLPPYLAFPNGEFAVSFFLMLSGFSIAMSLSKNDSQEKVQRMILGRYLRFALPMAIVTTIAYWGYIMKWYFASDVATILNQTNGSMEYKDLSVRHYLATLLLAPMGYNALNSPIWMMKYIFEGTFVIIILNFAIKSLKFKNTVFVLLFFLLLSFLESIYLADVIAGMLIFIVWHKRNDNFTDVPFRRVLIILFLVIAYYISVSFRRQGAAGVSILTQIAHLLGSISLIVCMLMSKIIQKLLASKPMAFMGSISFEFYLIHYVVVCSFSSWMWLKCSSLEYNYLNWLNFLLTFALVTMLSYLMKKYAEPFICKPLESRIINKLIN